VKPQVNDSQPDQTAPLPSPRSSTTVPPSPERQAPHPIETGAGDHDGAHLLHLLDREIDRSESHDSRKGLSSWGLYVALAAIVWTSIEHVVGAWTSHSGEIVEWIGLAMIGCAGIESVAATIVGRPPQAQLPRFRRLHEMAGGTRLTCALRGTVYLGLGTAVLFAGRSTSFDLLRVLTGLACVMAGVVLGLMFFVSRLEWHAPVSMKDGAVALRVAGPIDWVVSVAFIGISVGLALQLLALHPDPEVLRSAALGFAFITVFSLLAGQRTAELAHRLSVIREDYCLGKTDLPSARNRAEVILRGVDFRGALAEDVDRFVRASDSVGSEISAIRAMLKELATLRARMGAEVVESEELLRRSIEEARARLRAASRTMESTTKALERSGTRLGVYLILTGWKPKEFTASFLGTMAERVSHLKQDYTSMQTELRAAGFEDADAGGAAAIQPSSSSRSSAAQT
jgi:hypothetical protein